MKDVTNINFDASSKRITDEIFWNKELWDSKHVMYAMRLTDHILDAQYEKSKLFNVASENKYLSEEYFIALHTLLTKYELLFERTLGT